VVSAKGKGGVATVRKTEAKAQADCDYYNAREPGGYTIAARVLYEGPE